MSPISQEKKKVCIPGRYGSLFVIRLVEPYYQLLTVLTGKTEKYRTFELTSNQTADSAKEKQFPRTLSSHSLLKSF